MFNVALPLINKGPPPPPQQIWTLYKRMAWQPPRTKTWGGGFRHGPEKLLGLQGLKDNEIQ